MEVMQQKTGSAGDKKESILAKADVPTFRYKRGGDFVTTDATFAEDEPAPKVRVLPPEEAASSMPVVPPQPMEEVLMERKRLDEQGETLGPSPKAPRASEESSPKQEATCANVCRERQSGENWR